MKNLILGAAVAVLPLLANAQKLELGANAGGNLSFSQSASHASGDFSIRAAYNVNRNLQFGVSSAIHWQAYEINFNQLYFEDNLGAKPVDVHLTGSQAVNSLKAFFNVKRSWYNLEVYGGVSGGYVMRIPNGSFISQEALRNGHTAGVQGGATYYVTKNLGINAEIGANYINMGGNGDFNRDAIHTRLTGYNFPVTAGIRYKLFCHCGHSCPLGGE